MKKYGILILAGLVLAVMALVSCDKDNPLGLQEGGILTVKNTFSSEKDPVFGTELNTATVTISKGGIEVIPSAENKLYQEQIEPGRSKDFKITENGIYRVDWLTPNILEHAAGMPQTATMLAGNKITIEIK